MPVRLDPDETETEALLRFSGGLAGQRVLEVGCGDGRLTWRYAAGAAHVVAFDPDPARIEAALAGRPPRWRERVEFLVGDIHTFPTQAGFDLVILSWSL